MSFLFLIYIFLLYFSSFETDAQTAIEKLNGTMFRGRKLVLELGLKKERKGKNKLAAETTEDNNEQITKSQEEEEQKEIEPKKTPEDKKLATKSNIKVSQDTSSVTTADINHIKRSRQVLVFGVPTDLNKKHFRAIAVKGRKTEVELLKEVCIYAS